MSSPSNSSSAFPDIPGYTLLEQLYLGSRTVTYRGIQQRDQQPVVIKLLRQERPSFAELVQFRNQYAIAKTLDLPGILQPLSLEPTGNSYALIMEDWGGVSLKDYSQQHSLDLAQILAIAIQVAQILHDLHQQRVIHKDIKPANLLIHPQTQEIKLIDFSIASQLPKEVQEIQTPNTLQGTLAYLAPEQTGRMNRGIDYRADYYAFGVTLYQLLSGQLPFRADDPLELIHSHIAKIPTPLHQVNPSIPEPVAALVGKLMAKNAEDRYQSALGLKHDLEQCLTQWHGQGAITPLELGQRDISDRFLIPEKLYGREAQVQTLLNAFERVSQGPSEIMLVAGFSGIGKTAVVQEVHKPILEKRGYFIQGKFDQFKRNIPLDALVQAVEDLIEQLLYEPDDRLRRWNAAILEVLGDNGQVLIDVIPELEQIIGPQPPAPELSGTAAQNRFNRLFQQFIECFAEPEHPLVIFLDDLQWADSASIQLLKLLLKGQGSLFLLGAYRDNEVSPGHPLLLALEELQQAHVPVNTIHLGPLQFQDINQLVADTLNCSPEPVHPLTEFTARKTQGNPFFISQFLKTLHRDGYIHFNPQHRHWDCEIRQIETLSLTEDLVEFLAEELQKLPPESQSVLKLAACIGNEFDLATLSIVCQQAPRQVAIALWAVLQEGLIFPTSALYQFFQDDESSAFSPDINPAYRFLHDRIQQAAYLLIPDSEKPATHWQIGQLLLQRGDRQTQGDKLFDIVNQLNAGTALITTPAQQQQVVELNLEAGRKAVAAAAYKTAATYFQAGLSQLPPQSWEQIYDLTLTLYRNAVEVAYLNGEFQVLEDLAQEVLDHAESYLDQIPIYDIKIQSYIAQNRLPEALALGKSVLAQLDIHLPDHPTPDDTTLALARVEALLAHRPVHQLLDLPPMQNAEKLATLRILITFVSISFVAYPGLLPLVISEQVSLLLQHGNSSGSAFTYAAYGLILSNLGQFAQGFEFGQLAMELIEKFNAKSLKASVLNMVYSIILPWQQPLRDCLTALEEGYQTGLEAGDLEYAAYCILHHNEYEYFCGKNLSHLGEKLAHYSQALADINQLNTLAYHEIYRQTVLNLLDAPEKPTELVGAAYNERQSLPRHYQMDDRYAIYQVYLQKLILSYLLGEIEQGREWADLAKPYINGAPGLYSGSVFYFYDSLVQLADYSHRGREQQEAIWQRVEENQEKLQRWTQAAPANFQHKFELVEAERYRMLGENMAAMEAYDRAIAGAKAAQYPQEEALACERAAQFYRDWGKDKIAQVYLTDAYYGYIYWGAKTKVVDLERRYPRLLGSILNPERSMWSMTDTLLATESITVTQTGTSQSSSADSTSLSASLDLATVLKASQTLSGEMDLNSLLARLLEIVLKNAGADKGLLLMPQGSQWFIEAIATLEEAPRVESIPLSDYPEIAETLVHTVRRSLKPMVIGNALGHPRLRSDRYVREQQPKSLLGIPIVQQGTLIGVLYLENQQTIGAFTGDRVETLQILAAQAAISIQNARLYQQVADYSHTLEGEVERKTQALRQKALDLEATLTHLQQTQTQLIQSEKMSALGQLVGGIAHEINNPINFIHGNLAHAEQYVTDLLSLVDCYQEEYPQENAVVQTLRDEIELSFIGQDYQNLFKSMQAGSERIKTIILSLRNFSRLDESDIKTVDLHEGLESTLMILQGRLAGDSNTPPIEVVKEYGTLPGLSCYASQINQVFLSLLSNAIDALRNFQKPGVKPTIWIKTKGLDSAALEVTISDNGNGISDEIKDHIFEPFFTTKSVGQGTGLGLSVSYAIISRHGGSLTCQSQVGVGTDLIIRLPESGF
ncbi:trifunctional serine/threonine-protein kinase/ATP-binding protein/sensor histidine kinase [Laspinema sp. A4]|uniref:trifunctional serine/threonine-protein kinase/ATP-binding protein/sensor histidine kinase n=1 Tax=Laspinema sp. D2d TaxID=2953686 RepID=UPI0021BB5D67|nr:ATP-binding sensor histidine kinase [Laspinema sp. D2d]MCT7982488.1 trifunctional serine/threonine-protein kinase/ATP-binding protein/sensor histidine kinase [Laspinema sp. D2d]